MAVAGGSAAAAAAAETSSSYRVKFKREQFLEIIDIAKPEIIYHRKRMHFFSFDGFVMYTFECEERDLIMRGRKVIEAIEFSNRPWNE